MFSKAFLFTSSAHCSIDFIYSSSLWDGLLRSWGGICGVHEANMLQNLICFSKKKIFFSLLPWYFSPIQNLEINVVSIIGEGVHGYRTLHRGSAI